MNTGAVNLDECIRDPYGRCTCEKCLKCGFNKHMGIHGPVYGKPPGSKPWGHEYVATTNNPGNGGRKP